MEEGQPGKGSWSQYRNWPKKLAQLLCMPQLCQILIDF